PVPRPPRARARRLDVGAGGGPPGVASGAALRVRRPGAAAARGRRRRGGARPAHRRRPGRVRGAADARHRGGGRAGVGGAGARGGRADRGDAGQGAPVKIRRIRSEPGRGGSAVPETLGRSVFDGELGFPLMVVHRDALDHNIATLAAFARDHGLELAPHAKTHMSPEIAARQLGAGAWGLTVATPAQARTVRGFGVRRVLVANQVVDPAGLRWAAAELDADPDFTLLSFADSQAGVDILAAHAGSRPFPVLAELGHPGGRAGCRTVEELLELARYVERTDGVELAGVAGYEGALGTAQEVRKYLDLLQEAVEHLRVRTPILTVGGSQWFDVIGRHLAATQARVLLRSGAYVTHDDGFYRERTPYNRMDGELRPALEV